MAKKTEPNHKAAALGGAALIGTVGLLIADAGYDPKVPSTKRHRASLKERAGLVVLFSGVGALLGFAMSATKR